MVPNVTVLPLFTIYHIYSKQERHSACQVTRLVIAVLFKASYSQIAVPHNLSFFIAYERGLCHPPDASK